MAVSVLSCKTSIELKFQLQPIDSDELESIIPNPLKILFSYTKGIQWVNDTGIATHAQKKYCRRFEYKPLTSRFFNARAVSILRRRT